jgi:hypothetical protein
MEIGEHGNNLNLNIGGRVTCGLGHNLLLHGAKEAAQKIRKRRIPHGSTTMLKSNRRYQQLSSAVHPGLEVECLQGSAHVAEPDRIGSPGQLRRSDHATDAASGFVGFRPRSVARSLFAIRASAGNHTAGELGRLYFTYRDQNRKEP